MVILDEVTGHEFEEVMQTVFRKLGYEDVRVSAKTGDEGRDIIMKEVFDDDSTTTVIVECKHTSSVGRPVIQKLHSAVQTYDSVSRKKGIVVTTGQFSTPAKQYADDVDIELIDGADLRDIASQIGMDLYNGRFDIICEKMLSPYHPEAVTEPFLRAFDDVNGITRQEVPPAETTLTLYPILNARTDISRTFETSVGVIHEIDDSSRYRIDASRKSISPAQDAIQDLLQNSPRDSLEVDEQDLSNTFDGVNQRRFERTETEYRNWLKQKEIEGKTEVVTYTGDNNVEYEKTCEPGTDDVEITHFDPLYVPRINATITLKDYTYSVDWFANGAETVTTGDTIRDCVHCEGTIPDIERTNDIVHESAKLVGLSTYTYCDRCGGIACQTHTVTGEVTGETLCRECSVGQRFAGAKKYFAEKEQLEEYQEEYDQKEIYEKPTENLLGTVSLVIAILLFAVVLLL